MSDTRSTRVFSPDIRGVFVARPNRFEIIARSGERNFRAHCPNPGRMQEILLPGTEVYLEKAVSPSRSTDYTFVAAVHRGEIVMLHSGRTNAIASQLALPVLFDEPVTVRREAVRGSSRFDFAVETKAGTVLVEVKSCTLCEHGVAMFPDAPSKRAVRHVSELTELARNGEIAGGMVLFVIGHPSPAVFMPNIHTDPEFSRALAEARKLLTVRACSISVSEDGTARLTDPDVPISYRPVRLTEEDRGIYLIVLFLGSDRSVSTGALGEIAYRRGWYVYVGSAKRNLSSRVRRHLGRRKKLRWHIDYLTRAADSLRAYPVYTDLDLECDLAGSVSDAAAAAGGTTVTGFGASDCSCTSHLFRFTEDPFSCPAFVETLFYYRHHRGVASLLSDFICHREP